MAPPLTTGWWFASGGTPASGALAIVEAQSAFGAHCAAIRVGLLEPIVVRSAPLATVATCRRLGLLERILGWSL